MSLCDFAGLWVRRPPGVHGPFERERVQERDGVLVAVDCEVAVSGRELAACESARILGKRQPIAHTAVRGRCQRSSLNLSTLPTRARALKTAFGGFVTRISLGYLTNSIAA
jgi:hypothetical protein